MSIFASTAPNLPPLNFSSNSHNSTSVQLTWLPPELSGQNGIIQHYIISIIEVDTSRQFQAMSSAMSATVGALHPYYTYTFTVAAVTVGQGPYSEEVSVRTLEDGEQIYRKCSNHSMNRIRFI